MKLTVNVEEVTKGLLSGSFAQGVVREATKLAVRNLAEEARNQILMNLTGRILRVRTGKLRSDWSRYPQFSDGPSGPQATLSSNTIYAAIHEFGSAGLPTGAIVPVRAKWLVFKIGDRWVKTQRVVMPARHYISIAIDYVRAKSDSLTRTAVVEAFEKAGLKQ